MSAQIFDDYSPEDSVMTLGKKRPWGEMDMLLFGDGSGDNVSSTDVISVVKSLNRPIFHHHDQSLNGGASTTWVVNHNLNNTRPVIIVEDENANEVAMFGKDFAGATPNSITLTMYEAISGHAYVYGGIGGAGGSQSRYLHNQDDHGGASTTWVVNHNLNETVPTVLVLDSNNRELVCQPDYSTATPYSISLFFGVARTGKAYIGVR